MGKLNEFEFAVDHISRKNLRELVKRIESLARERVCDKQKIKAIHYCCEHVFLFLEKKKVKKERYKQLHLFEK